MKPSLREVTIYECKECNKVIEDVEILVSYEIKMPVDDFVNDLISAEDFTELVMETFSIHCPHCQAYLD